MQYTLTFEPDPDVIKIGITKKVVRKEKEFVGIEDVTKTSRIKYPFVFQLFQVEGVLEVILNPYEILIVKGSAFDWKDMLPAILSIIGLCLSPHDELEESRKPMREVVEKGRIIRLVPVDL